MNVPYWLDDVMPLPDAGRDLRRVITATDARGLGVEPHTTRYRVRVGRWARLAPGVYLTAPPATAADHALAAVLHGGPSAVLSGSAALHQYGLLKSEPGTDLVLVPSHCAVHSHGRVRIRPTHRLPKAADPWGLLAPAARAVADHARTVTSQDLVTRLVTAAVQKRLCSVDELSAEYRYGARRGSLLLRRALEDAGAGAHSVPEARAGRLLRAGGVTGFEHNAPVQVGGATFYGDFVWRTLRAILEIDSTEHHFSPADQTATLVRDQKLQLAGWAVMHVKPSQLRTAERFVEMMRSWLTVLEGRRSA